MNQNKQDARVIGLVGFAHGISHFYHLILVALFPWIKDAFNLTYAQLGLLMTAFFVVSGIGQAVSGFVVDRVGALKVLGFGLATLALSSLAAAVAPSYPMLMAASVLAGLGNSVFHPADYSLLNHHVSKPNMAHAFSVHGITGNLGWGAAPIVLAGVAGLSDWRTALMTATVLPLLSLASIFWQRNLLHMPPAAAKMTAKQGGALDFLRLPAIWVCFGYFFLTAASLSGIQGFSASALMATYGVTRATAVGGFTAYMLCSAVGMVIGGFVGARSARHDRIIAFAFGLAAVMALVLAGGTIPAWLAMGLMGAIGFAAGIAGPSRDLLIRAAAPKNATGRVFGVVYSGLDSGLAIGPIFFGLIMDANHPSWVFIGVAVFQALAIVTASSMGMAERSPVPQKA